MSTKKNLLLIIALIVISIIASLFINKDTTELSIENETLVITDPSGETKKIQTADIDSVELQTKINFGSLVQGKDSEKYKYGIWKNNEWGEYYLCVNPAIDAFIIIKTSDSVAVFNYINDQNTNEFFDAFINFINQ